MRADFSSQSYFRNPAAEIAKLRSAGPVVEVRFPIVGRVWTTTTQDLAERVLKDSETFTLRRDDGSFAGFQWWMPGVLRTLANNMLSMDEPDHTRLRDVVEEAFRRRAVLDMEPRILAIADELADELFAEGNPADLVDRYARKLPLSVICELLGLPPGDRPKFIAWASGFTRFTGTLGFLSIIPNIFAMKRYMQKHVEHVRAIGGEGLVAELVRVEREGGQISRDEMVAMLFLLLFAGHETTTHLISGSVHELLKNPGLRDWLKEDWSRANLAVEEFLRFISPVQFTKPRFVRKDVTLGGVQLRKGEKIMPMLAAAKSRSAGQCRSGATRSREKAEPACRLRHRESFLSWSSACAHRGNMRAEGPVRSLAGTGTGRGRIANQVARAARHEGDRTFAGRHSPPSPRDPARGPARRRFRCRLARILTDRIT
jgi:cytochrome P450